MHKSRLKQQKGSALVYILIAIALLAALTATFMDNSSQQTSSQNTFNTVTDLNSQINFIRSAIQECVLTFPGGDQSAGFISDNLPYPVNPTSSYFTGATPGQAPDNHVSFLRCPGNPGDSNNHARIFGGSSGKFLPPPPSLFLPWEYYSGPDGVFFYTYTDKTDSFLSTALAKLDDQFSECEADVIPGGGTLMTSDPVDGPVCPLTMTACFRVWLIANPSAVYPDPAESCP